MVHTIQFNRHDFGVTRSAGRFVKEMIIRLSKKKPLLVSVVAFMIDY